MQLIIILGGEEEQSAVKKGSQAVVGITKELQQSLKLPEGTQMPFIVGEFLDYEDSTNDSNYTSLINHDTKVVGNNNMPYGGDLQKRITVAANTAGIITAYNSNSGATLFMSNKVSVLLQMVKQQTHCLFIQQVQRTG